MRFLFAFLFAFVAMSCAAQPASVESPVVPNESSQMIVVTTQSWDATNAHIQLFERDAGVWLAVSDGESAVVGRSGLGWGTGLHPVQNGGPSKREGDGRAPAGVFDLTATFGYADSMATGLPYVYSTSDVECVDDSESDYYNEVLDRTTVDPDWNSHEEMRRRDELYEIGVVVAHNEDAVPRGGSCIFLHIWRGPNSTTSGCTAMPSNSMQHIAEWLDDEAHPVLVQLPQSEYERLRIEWGLP